MRRTTGNLSSMVIGCAITVHKALGEGFLEAVYERALAIELDAAGVRFQRQVPVKVRYRECVVGAYVADFTVESRLVLELKAAKNLDVAYEIQLLNDLKATGYRVGLLLNFGTRRLQVKRMVSNLEVERSI